MPDDFKGKLKRIRTRGPLAIKVYDNVKEAVIRGVFAPGTWLQEEQLTKAMGISRTPLREAFNRLQSEGLIQVIPRRGAYIVELSDIELIELFEAREIVETTFFIRSVQNIKKDRIARFREELAQKDKEMQETKNEPELWDEKRKSYLKIDRSLHDALIAASGNHYWEKIYNNLRDRIEMYGNQISLDEKWFPVAIHDHYAIIDAILANKHDKAKNLMADHIGHVREGIIRIRNFKPESL